MTYDELLNWMSDYANRFGLTSEDVLMMIQYATQSVYRDFNAQPEWVRERLIAVTN